MNVKERLLEKIGKLIHCKEKLKGSWIHKILGERLFSPDLWWFSRKTVAGGAALGVFIAMTPTMPFHMMETVIMGLILRVNIPVALAASWIVNPVMYPFVCLAEYKVGVWLVGIADPGEYTGYTRMFRHFFRVARPLFAGTLILGIPPAAVSYLMVYFGWDFVRKFLKPGDSVGPSEGDDA